ncbi:MAG TPA: RNA polymerase sigma factor [Phycisphaerales bacterium]|nr:RNA polymerase sigma factor [Phycisphaerales bacterium]
MNDPAGPPAAPTADGAGTGDQSLVREAIRGDEESLRELWNRHRRWVAAVLLAHMPRDAELDDLLQEVAVAVVAKISGLREEAAFKPWLRAVALSIAKTSARRRTVRKAGWFRLVGFAGARADERAHDHASPAMREGRRLMDLSAELPDGYREPLLLKCIHDMSYKQIGDVMGLPDTTIETRIARARKMLRERALAAGLGPESPGRGRAGPSDSQHESSRA